MTTSPVRTRLTREESRLQTRAALLDAAKTLFARQGFEGTSVEHITEAAGYSRGAFYSNFEDKQVLLIALIERCFEDDLAGVAQLNGSMTAVSAGFQQAADLEDTRHREAHLLKMEFWMCALRYPAVREAYERHHSRLRTAIGTLIEAQFAAMHRSLPAPADQLAAVVVALRNGLDTQKLINGAAIPNGLYGLTLHLLLTGQAPTE
ncbi:TetR/AcrR family transcriptional regulator [Deinococcus sp. Arct2-2]|uniref:TetR/AcrR family transcriptional regulator n=1 Tax=Deinococcus sp. Arct2-2 TaxID=2568653 RepID=UPI0010A36C31|nr:TetR/AcrR family transcriptional regulator [Deinococcus sp. Arct2-2]THF66728.1 TetR/AcrR family transcriptional regulator [Deinococcus sp. Arct2-2]